MSPCSGESGGEDVRTPEDQNRLEAEEEANGNLPGSGGSRCHIPACRGSHMALFETRHSLGLPWLCILFSCAPDKLLSLCE